MKKKNVIILGGNNNCNISWLKKMKREYKKSYNVFDMYFDNWIDNSDMDFEIELEKFRNIVEPLDEYFVVAKSAGAILSLMAINKEFIMPEKIVIMGVPLVYAERKKIDIEELLSLASKKSNILIIQQKNDPQGKYQDIVELITPNIQKIEIKGNHHTYGKINYIKTIVDTFLETK